MVLSNDDLQKRIEQLELWTNYLQTGLNNTATRRELKNLMALVSSQVTSLSDQVGTLDATGALYPPRLTTTERDALTATDGATIFNTTTEELNIYASGEWREIGSGFIGGGGGSGAAAQNQYFLSDFSPATLNQAVSTLGSNEATLIMDIASDLSDDVLVPENLTIQFLIGAVISGPYVISFDESGLDAGLFQIFDSDVTVSGPKVRTQYIRPEWFGAFANNVDCTVAFQQAVDFALTTKGGVELRLAGNVLSNSRYLITDTIDITNRITIRGASVGSAILFNPAVTGIPCLFLSSNNCDSCIIENFGILGVGKASDGIVVGQTDEQASRNRFIALNFTGLDVAIHESDGISNLWKDCLLGNSNTCMKFSNHTVSTVENIVIEGFTDYGIWMSGGGLLTISGGTIEGGLTGTGLKVDEGVVSAKHLWLEDNGYQLNVGTAGTTVGEFQLEHCVIGYGREGPSIIDDVRSLTIERLGHYTVYNDLQITENVKYKNVDVRYILSDNGVRTFIDNGPIQSVSPCFSTNFSETSDLTGAYFFNPDVYMSFVDENLDLSTSTSIYKTGDRSLHLNMTGDGSVHRDVRFTISNELMALQGWTAFTVVARIHPDSNVANYYLESWMEYGGGQQAQSYLALINDTGFNLQTADDWIWIYLPIDYETCKAASSGGIVTPSDVEAIKFEIGVGGDSSNLYVDSIDIYPGTTSISLPSKGHVGSPTSEHKTRLLKLNDNSVLYSNAAPTTGIWKQGDRVYNNAPIAGGTEGWVCVTAGEPGTWKTFGSISA